MMGGGVLGSLEGGSKDHAALGAGTSPGRGLSFFSRVLKYKSRPARARQSMCAFLLSRRAARAAAALVLASVAASISALFFAWSLRKREERKRGEDKSDAVFAGIAARQHLSGPFDPDLLAGPLVKSSVGLLPAPLDKIAGGIELLGAVAVEQPARSLQQLVLPCCPPQSRRLVPGNHPQRRLRASARIRETLPAVFFFSSQIARRYMLPRALTHVRRLLTHSSNAHYHDLHGAVLAAAEVEAVEEILGGKRRGGVGGETGERRRQHQVH